MKLLPPLISLCFLFLSLNPLIGQDNIKTYSSIGMHEQEVMGIYADFESSITDLSLAGEVHFNSNEAIVSSPETITINAVEFNLGSILLVESELAIQTNADFNSGIVWTDRQNPTNHFVHFLVNSKYTGLSENSYVDGFVAKTGPESFVFPVGQSNNIKPLKATSKSSSDYYLKASFIEHDVAEDLPTLPSGLCTSVYSNKGYWTFENLSSVSDISVELTYGPQALPSDQPCENVVASWSGSEWISEGNGGIIGDNLLGGKITSGDGCGACGNEQIISQFSYLTIAAPISITPVNFLSFTGSMAQEDIFNLYWTVSYEKDNELFIIEKSNDGINWTEFATVESLGDTSEKREYQYTGSTTFSSTIYFRLLQKDQNGSITYSDDIVSFNAEDDLKDGFKVYPNPFVSKCFLEVDSKYVGYNLRIIDMLGEIKMTRVQIGKIEVLDFANLASGTYFLEIINPQTTEITINTKLIKY